MPMPFYIDTADRRSLRMLQRGMDEFRAVKNAMPLQAAAVLLSVMIREDQTTNELSEAAGITPMMVSRQIADYGRMNRYNQPVYGLAETHEDISDRRFHRTSLTPLG